MRSRESAVVHRLTGRGSFALYAVRSYLERRLRSGRLSVAQLAYHDFIGDQRWNGDTPKWGWLGAHGAVRSVIRANSDVAILAAARLGQGIAMLPTHRRGDADVATNAASAA